MPDPRSWSREDVAVFVRYCEREFDLEKIDMDKFQMNGEFYGENYVLNFCLNCPQSSFFVITRKEECGILTDRRGLCCLGLFGQFNRRCWGR